MQIVGRDRELEQVRRFLADAASGLRLLHLRGEPGIGKSTLWQAALSEGTARGYRVVSTRPTEAEARLPFAALNDLAGDLLDEIRPELALPQRYALDVALLRTPSVGPPPEPLAIALATLGLLRAAADDRPLLIGIDDIPWLDESTASVLDFVVRRLDDAAIGIVGAERTGVATAPSAWLLSAIPAERVTRIQVAPLGLREVDLLLGTALGAELPPSVLSQVHRASGGNPMYAVELGRAVQERGMTGMEGTLPLPETLVGLVRDRIADLSPPASIVVGYAAALSQPTIARLEAAVGAAEASLGLRDAQAAGVLTTDENAVRFTHPLLAAEAYGRISPAERRRMHRRLAETVSEREEHARHLALGTEDRDEAVAQELEQAAASAHERGAPDAAAELVERSIALTPEGETARWHREALAGRYRWMAGDAERAVARLEAALGDAPAGRARAEILLRLGDVEQLKGDWTAAGERFRRALDEPHDDVRLIIEVKLAIAGSCHVTGRDWDLGWQHASDAMRLAEELNDPTVLASTVGHYATWRYLTGRGYSHDLEQRAAELEPWTASLRALDHPDFDMALMHRTEGDLGGSRKLLEGLLERAERTGDYSSLTFVLVNLAGANYAEGRSDLAWEQVERAERIARATGQRTTLASVLSARTGLLTRIGRAEAAWDTGRAALDLIAETGWAMGEVHVRVELATLELSRRNPSRALEALAGLERLPLTHASRAWFLPVWIESLTASGRLDEARSALAGIDGDARVAQTPLLRANRDVVAALLAAAQGSLDEATRLASAAIAVFAADTDRWALAKAQLVAGEVQRRARRRAKARAALRQAVAGFEALGSELWAKLAREQLVKLGGSGVGQNGLTPTQQQVGELVMGGLTNRQVADRLFMSPHTVEAHLTAIYRKLGIRRRSELTNALGQATTRSPRDSRRPARDSGEELPLEK